MPAPLDTLESAVQLARVRLGDAIASIGGDVVTDAQPFTLDYINAGWRRLQEYAVSLGFSWLVKEVVLSNVTASAVIDPAVQVYIDWDKYHDGTVAQVNPKLPQDLIAPIDLWERLYVTGPMIPSKFYTMDEIKGGFPAVPKGLLNKRWQWRQGAIYLPGAAAPTDIRLRYSAFLADFVAASTTPFASQTIPVLRMRSPLSWYICSESSHARGGLNATFFDDQAKAAMDLALTTDGEVVP